MNLNNQRESFDEKLLSLLKEFLKNKRFRKGDESEFRKLILLIKALFAESIFDDIHEILSHSVVSSKRELYRHPNKTLKPFTVITNYNKPVGCYIDLSLSKRLHDKNSALFLILTLIENLTLEVYKNHLCDGKHDITEHEEL